MRNLIREYKLISSYKKIFTTIVSSMISTDLESVSQMRDSFPFPVLFDWTTISVMAILKQARIEWVTTMARNPITPIITRWGKEEPEIDIGFKRI